MATHDELILDQFTRQAEAFAKSRGHLDDGSLQRLARCSALDANDVVLDVACGTGMVACAFASIARQVTGVDLTPAMLNQARDLQRDRGLNNVTWDVGDATALPYQDEAFSLVVSRYAFHHAPDPARMLFEMVRVCQRGGRVVVSDGCPPPEKAEAYHRFEKLMDPSHARALTEPEFESIFRAAGLINVRKTWDALEMELERSLASAFPNAGDETELRRMVHSDADANALGLNVHRVGDEWRYAYPILIIVGQKPQRCL